MGMVSSRDKATSNSIRVAPGACERFHGAWGGGQPAGAASGSGLPYPFPRENTSKRLQMMVEQEASLDYNSGRGPRSASRESTRNPDFTKEKISRMAWTAPPGYSGYTPGVHAQNVFGQSYHRGAKEAITRLRKHRDGTGPNQDERGARWIQPSTGREAARIGTTGSHSMGCEIPGYSGFVPRSYAGNLVGVCVPRATKMGWVPGQDGPNPPLIVHAKRGLPQA